MKSRFAKTMISIIVIFLSTFVPLDLLGASWTESGSYSISWYDKNKTEFDISTPQELAGVAYLVNNNFTSFSGKTLNITSDIDLSGKSWTPIGLGNTNFQGSIEGGNHTISNISIVSGTSGAPYGSGMWIKLQNAVIKNLKFEGTMNVDNNYIGFIASTAQSCSFENISVSCSIYYNKSVSASTSFKYSSRVAGMISEATSCTFDNVYVHSDVDYTFGSSSGSSMYGKIEVKSGGIVGKGENDKFTKCHAINDYWFSINGYETTSTYTGCGDSFVTYGGIVGFLTGSSSSVIGCLAENKYFTGRHDCGTFDTTRFRFGGLVGYMSKYDYSTLKNCVAINGFYNIIGHSYSWQASWYHTNSYFGGVAYEVPKDYAGCYSNNDVSKSIEKVQTNQTCESGSTSFSKSQMNTQAFVDELNLFSQLAFDEDYWELSSGKLCIKQKDDDNGVHSVLDDNDDTILGVYNMQGLFVGRTIEEDFTPGIYIVRYPNSTKKILLK